jgi:hypothetical protein
MDGEYVSMATASTDAYATVDEQLEGAFLALSLLEAISKESASNLVTCTRLQSGRSRIALRMLGSGKMEIISRRPSCLNNCCCYCGGNVFYLGLIIVLLLYVCTDFGFRISLTILLVVLKERC